MEFYVGFMGFYCILSSGNVTKLEQMATHHELFHQQKRPENPLYMEVLLGTSPINSVFSSTSFLITGGYVLQTDVLV